MGRILINLAMLVVLSSVVYGQSTNREDLTFQFVVRTDQGAPLPGVLVCTTSYYCSPTTATGEFTSVMVDGPKSFPKPVRFMKKGYCPVTLPINADQKLVEVVLHPCRGTERKIPLCSRIKGRRKSGTSATKGAFSFHVPEGVLIRQERDYDYGVDMVGFGNGETTEWLQLGSGRRWSSGLPRGRWVAQSVRMLDRNLITEGKEPIVENLAELGIDLGDGAMLDGVDIQGFLPDGRRWRFVGDSGTTVSYGPSSPEAADFFDGLLETLCLTRSR